MTLTAIQEDYLEVIYHLSTSDAGVRTTDIADRLGCRLPTVTRTVQKMAEMGLVDHESRGLIRLTELGHSTAEDIAHRHKDTVAFLVRILGMTEAQAERDACQVEHGLSPLAAQRLHEFLEYVNDLEEFERRIITKFARTASTAVTDFRHLLETKTAGWRGKRHEPATGGRNNMTLLNANMGQTVSVVGLTAEGLVRRRLLDLGFTPGTRIDVLQRSPLGDPVAYRVRGVTIALRGVDAGHVQIAS